MVSGGMVATICVSAFVVNGICCGVQSLWLIIRMVVVFVPSLAAIMAQWMASTVVLWSVGYARPMPFHMEDCACPMEPNILS